MLLSTDKRYYEYTDYNDRFVNVMNNADIRPYTNIYKLNDYLYEVFYEDIDYEYASKFFLQNYSKATASNPVGGCTSVRKGNYYGRNLDWDYDEEVTFIMHTPNIKNRYASISVGGYSPKFTKDAVQNRTITNNEWVMLPFRTVDGLNEKGLFVNTNTAPTGDLGITKGTNPGKKEISTTLMVRFILDHFSTALEACEYIKNELSVYTLNYPFVMESHFMIGDSSTTYVVEFHNNQCVYKEYDGVNNYAIMSNFYQNTEGVINSDNTVNYTNSTPHGQGLERWNLIVNKYNTLTTLDSMKNLMRNDLKYTNSYLTTINPFWLTEYTRDDEYGNLTVQDVVNNPSKFDTVKADLINEYNNRQRDGKTWQTCHSSVYDLANKKLYVTNQEDTSVEYEFNLNDYLHGTAKKN